MTDDSTGCELDEVRFFDGETKEWGYMVECVAEGHTDRAFGDCPGEHEMFRLPRREDTRP